MCIRDSRRPFGQERDAAAAFAGRDQRERRNVQTSDVQATRCLLYTSDAADERSSVDLGGRRIIKKKKNVQSSRLADP